MARRNNRSSSKVFGLVLTVGFGLIALIISYAALKGGLELRSKAAQEQAVYGQWEFNGTSVEGWKGIPPNTTAARNGALVVLSPDVAAQAKATVRGFHNTSVQTNLPKGAKKVTLSLAVDAAQRGTPPPPPPIVCAQVITSAKNDTTGECKDFATPCDVPKGWSKVRSCEGTDTKNVQGVSDETDELEFQQSVREKTACTLEAKQCPDGSWVGRIGPECRFEPCSPKTPEPKKRTFAALLYYKLANKKKFEKPVKFTGIADRSFHEYTVALPDVGAVNIERLRIVFTSGVRAGELVSVDWIRLTGVAPKPTPIPPKGCQYKQVQCVKAPCDPILICPTTTIRPRPPTITPKPRNDRWCKIVKFLPGGTSTADYKRDCL